MKTKIFYFTAAVTVMGVTSFASAGIIDPGLSGTVQTDRWDFAQALGTYGQPNDPTGWTSSIVSNIEGGNATFKKDSGYGYLSAGNGIYALIYTNATPNQHGADYTVEQTSVLSGLQTVVFQLDITDAFGYDFYDEDGDGKGDAPTLTYTTQGNIVNTVQSNPAYLVSRDFFQNFDVPVYDDQGNPVRDAEGHPITELEPAYRRTWLFQWDLSQIDSLSDPITSFDINWQVAAHTWMYNAQLDQSDVYTQVPEPAMLGLVALGGLVLLRRRNG